MLNQLLSNRYKIIRALDAGGMGQTYVAEDTLRPNNPKCVVKQLKPISTDPNFLVTARRLFTGEAEILEKLGSHDQIPRLLAYFEKDDEFYLVQEFVDGQPLSTELPLGQRWSEYQVIALLKDILVILEFIHGQGVIHRDIKPSNIMRRKQDGKLVLIDFGAVKQVQSQQTTAIGQISMTVAIGTLGYMPTEQASGKPRPSSDLYALGKVAIQALTGLLPSQLREDEDGGPIWRDQADVSDRLATVLAKMTRHYFKSRYQSAPEVLEALEGFEISNTSNNKGYTPTIVGENSSSGYTPTIFDPNESSNSFNSPKLLRESKVYEGIHGSPYFLGVSLGVSNSMALELQNGQFVKLVNIPSAVAYSHEGSCLAGEQAIEKQTSNISVFRDFIHFIGRRYDEVSQFITQTPYRIAKGSKGGVVLECSILNRWFSPEELLTELLCEILNQCDERRKNRLTGLYVIFLAIPTFLDNIACREIIKSSAREAGIDDLKIINETLSYGLSVSSANCLFLELKKPQLYLVIVIHDFCLACSILEINGGAIEVLCKLQKYVNIGIFSKPEGSQLVTELIEASLQSQKLTSVDVLVLPTDISKLPALQTVYHQKFVDKAKEIIWSKNGAAEGAALYTEILRGKNICVLDLVTTTMGIWTQKGIKNIIRANEQFIPTLKSELFLWDGGSHQIKIPIFEETYQNQESRILGIIQFEVAEICKLSVIEISFDIIDSYRLTVTVTDKINGNSQSSEITSHELLSFEEAIRLYDDSYLLTCSLKGQAIWHGSSADIPVEIEDFMGVENGEIYLKIKDSKTGIKLQEIEFF